jgi:large subunit ribosomal protein L33
MQLSRVLRKKAFLTHNTWRGYIMAKKVKGNRVQVILECTEHKGSGMPGTSRYITTKNRKNTTQRLELKKYNPVLKKMTVHKEIK